MVSKVLLLSTAKQAVGEHRLSIFQTKITTIAWWTRQHVQHLLDHQCVQLVWIIVLMYSGQEVQNTSVKGKQMQTPKKKEKTQVINLPQKLNWLFRCGKTKYEVGGRRRHACE